MKNKPFLKTIFYALIIIFVLILLYFFTPLANKEAIFLLVAILGFIFLILGIILTFIAKKEKGKLKLFLMITGISAIAPFVFTILHNVFYALAIVFVSFKYLFEALHVISFIISLIVAPIVFIVGVIGSIIFFKKSSK